MNPVDAIDQLRQAGDPLEVELAFHRSALELVLQPYARIWAEYIAPKRVDGGMRVPDGLMNFAGSHYSAIIRVFHAHQSMEDLLSILTSNTPSSGAMLINIHRHYASFWENIGSSIDNLAAAFGEAGLSDKQPPDYLTSQFGALAYAYDRRTQAIHSRIRPVKSTSNGFEIFYQRAERTNPANERKRTNWSEKFDASVEMSSHVDAEWNNFYNEMSCAWWQLHSKLKEQEKNRSFRSANHADLFQSPPFPVVLFPTGAGSGVPPSYYGPPPSG